jgi:hypothetical protein
MTLVNTVLELHEDGAETLKHVGAYVIKFNILKYVCTFVGTK